MSTSLTGGCACGAVRYALHQPPSDVADCHCRACQRATGALGVTWGSVSAHDLHLVRGEPRWWRSSASAERGFCERCGTSLFFRGLSSGGRSGELLDLTIASLDEPAAFPPQRAIWTASRPPWVHLDPSLPAHADGGPDWQPEPVPEAPTDVITYREGPPVDVVQLGALFRAVGFGRRSDPESLQAMLDGTRWMVSAWRGPELLGFCRAVSDGVSSAYVTSVAVFPQHQRQGVGREMMRRLLADRPEVKFTLHTSPAGRALYRSVGFADGADYMLRPRLSEGS